MAYNFLGLVNDVLARVNETKLTSANFSSAVGFYDTAKEAINSSIRHVNVREHHWDFNHIEQEDVLTAGENRYPLPDNMKVVNYNTFRIKRNDTFGNRTTKLIRISYEEFLDKRVDDEYNTSTGIRALPTHVFQALNKEYGVWPIPDQAYELVYEYFASPVDLNLYSDVPTMPEEFRNSIIDGAMYNIYLFRGDLESADRIWNKFNQQIDRFRSMYINKYDSMRDGRVDQPHYPLTLRT